MSRTSCLPDGFKRAWLPRPSKSERRRATSNGSYGGTIENQIDLSGETPISEDTIEQLVRQFCHIFCGDGSDEAERVSENTLLIVEVPNIVSMNTDVAETYQLVTFSKTVALEEPEAEFVSLNHPLVQAVIEYCIDNLSRSQTSRPDYGRSIESMKAAAVYPTCRCSVFVVSASETA